MKKLFFYVRRKVWAMGDYPFYFRVGGYITRNTDNEVYVDENRMIAETGCYDETIRTIDLEGDDVSDISDAVFLIPLNQLCVALEQIKRLPNARVCIISANPLAFDWFADQFPYYVKGVEKFVGFLGSRTDFAFADISNRLALVRHTGVEFNDTYFPVCIDINNMKEYRPVAKVSSEDCIRIGWFGRLDTDKIRSVLYFIECLDDTCGDLNIEFHMIGDGSDKSRINYSRYSEHIKFVFTSYIFDNDYLREYICDNTDFVVAMGISAIDIAKFGVPVLVPIVSSGKINNNKFIYLFDSIGYATGYDYDSFREVDVPKYTPREVIEDVIFKDRKTEYGKRCYDHVINNFTPEVSAKHLLEVVDSCDLTVKDVMSQKIIKGQFRRYNLYRKLRKHEFESYFEFVKKFNKIKDEKGYRKITYIARVLGSALKRKQRKNV